MNLIKTTTNLVEATYDPTVVKFNNTLYVIISQLGPDLSLVLKSEYDVDINSTLDLIASTDDFIKSLKELT